MAMLEAKPFRLLYFTLLPPAYPTLVRSTPLAEPKRASGNQNQDIPKVAAEVRPPGATGSGRGSMVEVPRSRTCWKKVQIREKSLENCEGEWLAFSKTWMEI